MCASVLWLNDLDLQRPWSRSKPIQVKKPMTNGHLVSSNMGTILAPLYLKHLGMKWDINYFYIQSQEKCYIQHRYEKFQFVSLWSVYEVNFREFGSHFHITKIAYSFNITPSLFCRNDIMTQILIHNKTVIVKWINLSFWN